jgi:hypothetical protein
LSQFLVGEFSAASYSSEPSNYSTLGSRSVPRFCVCRQVKNVLFKDTGAAPPHKSALRRKTPVTCYEKISNDTPSLCGEENIWMSIERTRNASGRGLEAVAGVLKKESKRYHRNNLFRHNLRFLDYAQTNWTVASK